MLSVRHSDGTRSLSPVGPGPFSLEQILPELPRAVAVNGGECILTEPLREQIRAALDSNQAFCHSWLSATGLTTLSFAGEPGQVVVKVDYQTGRQKPGRPAKRPATQAAGDPRASRPLRVVNLRGRPGRDVRDGELYIGRRLTMGGWDLQGSVWGNPFKVGRDGNIGQVLAKYRRHAQKTLGAQLRELRRDPPRALACFCAPEPCHGDVLRELLGVSDRGAVWLAEDDQEGAINVCLAKKRGPWAELARASASGSLKEVEAAIRQTEAYARLRGMVDRGHGVCVVAQAAQKKPGRLLVRLLQEDGTEELADEVAQCRV